MPREKYVPKHRHVPAAVETAPRPAKAPRTTVGSGMRNAALLSGVAVAATGITVSAGVVASEGNLNKATAAVSASTPVLKLSGSELASRVKRASRSSGDRLAGVDNAKRVLLSDTKGVAKTESVDLSSADPRTLAKALMPQYGLSASEFSCLDSIYIGESGWNVHADNPSSSAYGIPQALPGSKMASAGPDWENNPETQIRWGLGYIKQRYGSACSAWSFKQGHGWY